MRVKRLKFVRGFKAPMLPVTASCLLGVIVCAAMIYGLGWTNWLRLAVCPIGLVFTSSTVHQAQQAQQNLTQVSIESRKGRWPQGHRPFRLAIDRRAAGLPSISAIAPRDRDRPRIRFEKGKLDHAKP